MNISVVVSISLVLTLMLGATQSINADEPDEPIAAFQPLRILDVDSMQWDSSWAGLNGTSQGKLLYAGGGSLMLLVAFNPGWDAINKTRHYHDFHEWGYVLEGDFLIYDFVSPRQMKGTKYTMRSGTWMSRPPFSIHGNRPDAMVHQQVTTPSVQLVFAEGGKNYSFDPDNKWYSDDWRQVTEWTHPLYQNSALPENMEWEDASDLTGAKVKVLSDEIAGGFRARIVYVPAGWSYSGDAAKTYFTEAQRFHYVLAGDLTLGMGSSGETTTIRKGFFVEQPPMSVWQWADGPNSNKGGMWLEGTYAKGTRFGHGPIESARVLP